MTTSNRRFLFFWFIILAAANFAISIFFAVSGYGWWVPNAALAMIWVGIALYLVRGKNALRK